MITDLGHKLGKFAEAPKDRRRALIEECEVLANEIVATPKRTEQEHAANRLPSVERKSEPK